MKLFFLSFFLLNVTIALASNFSKNMYIKTVFDTETLKKEAKYENFILEGKRMREAVRNIFISYQHEFDFKMLDESQKGKADKFVCSGKLVNEAFMIKQRPNLTYNGNYFLILEIHDEQHSQTLFGKSFVIDQFLEAGKDDVLIHKMQQELFHPLSLYFFVTSRDLTTLNLSIDTIAEFAIDDFISSNSKNSHHYLKKMTNLLSNAIIINQEGNVVSKGKSHTYPFNFYRNYIKSSKKRKGMNNIFKGNLYYDASKMKYYLDIFLYIDGRKMPISKSMSPTIEFTSENKHSYIEVAVEVKNKIELLLYYYFHKMKR